MKSYDMKEITSAQIRAGRALVRWTALELAEHAQVGVATIRRAEGEDGALSMTPANQNAIRQALERAGVEFLAAGDPSTSGGVGVRMRRKGR